MLFRVRVDVEGVEPGVCPRSQLIEEWAKKANACVCVHHVLPNGRNPHYHLFVDAEYKSAQSLRYAVDKLFSVSGSDRSITPCDPERIDEYVQYLFNRKKGNSPTLRYSTMDTTEHQRKALEVKESFDSEAKKPAITAWQLAQETHQLATERIEEERVSHDYINQIYLESAVEIHQKHHKAFCEFSLMRVVQTALAETHMGRRAIVQRLLERMSRQ